MKRGLVPILVVVVVLVIGGGVVCLRCSSPEVATQSGGALDTSPDVSEPNGSGAPVERPAKWAQPVKLPGCPNLHKVSDDLYRGAQPTAEGMRQLRELGIKTIVDLRSLHSDRDEMGDLQFNYEQIAMKAWHAEDEDVVRFLKIVSDRSNAPFFVHCEHGADRTGTVCAVYRIAVQGWSKEEALKEMRDGGYGFHGVWRNLVRYINNLDIAEMKRRAGLQY